MIEVVLKSTTNALLEDDKAPSFEEGLRELEEIVAKMEEGRVALEEAVSLYERGMLLQKRCREQLENARLRIETLSLSEEGELSTKPFEIPGKEPV